MPGPQLQNCRAIVNARSGCNLSRTNCPAPRRHFVGLFIIWQRIGRYWISGGAVEGIQRRNREALTLQAPKDSWTAVCVVDGVVVEKCQRKNNTRNAKNHNNHSTRARDASSHAIGRQSHRIAAHVLRCCAKTTRTRHATHLHPNSGPSSKMQKMAHEVI